MKKRIVFIGSGNMAEAIIKSLVSKDKFEILAYDLDKDRLNYMENNYEISTCVFDERTGYSKVQTSDIILLAVKPNMAKTVFSVLKGFVGKRNIIVSIMAGIDIANITDVIGKDLGVVRVMPNTPAILGNGMSALTYSDNILDADKLVVKEVFSSIGKIVELPESDFDAVTAMSGSGPAYVFYFAEAMVKAGIDMGLSQEVASKLTVQTIFGAAAMLDQFGAPKDLRENVTSKGGTTAAAINSMQENGFLDIMGKAIFSARDRSKELREK